jgi:hypothetical protein
MSSLQNALAFHHTNWYAFGSCKEIYPTVRNKKNLLGALTDVIVNICEFEDRGDQFRRLKPTLWNVVTDTGFFVMPSVDKKMFLIFGGSGKLVSSDGSTTDLNGINFHNDLVFVTHDEKIISIEELQMWNLEYGLKCLVWGSDGSKAETSFSSLFPQLFSKANLHVEKVFESADEEDLLDIDEWPFFFQTEPSPHIFSNLFTEHGLDIVFSELEYKGVNDNPLGVMLNESDQIRRLNHKIHDPGIGLIQGLGGKGFIRNLGAYFQNSSEHYDLEESVRPILVFAFLYTMHGYRGGRIDSNLSSKIPLPLIPPEDRPIISTYHQINQDADLEPNDKADLNHS